MRLVQAGLEGIQAPGSGRLATWTPAAAASGNGEMKLDGEGEVTVLAMPAAVPTSRVGLGRLEDQESADGARGGGCGRAWWLPNTNVIRVKI